MKQDKVSSTEINVCDIRPCSSTHTICSVLWGLTVVFHVLTGSNPCNCQLINSSQLWLQWYIVVTLAHLLMVQSKEVSFLLERMLHTPVTRDTPWWEIQLEHVSKLDSGQDLCHHVKVSKIGPSSLRY